MVWLDDATQKAISLVEIKWTDRFAENPTELKSVCHFLGLNNGIKKIIVTSKTMTTYYRLSENEVSFIPSALYAYWVSDFLFRNRRGELLM